MQVKSNFLRISVFCTVILVFAVAGLASSSVQASQPAQAATGVGTVAQPTTTKMPTVIGTTGGTAVGTAVGTATTSASTGTTGGGAVAPAATTAATVPALATLGGDEAYPPCPPPATPVTTTGGTATMAATSTMAATTSAATMAATVATTMAATTTGGAATMAATMAMTSAGTAEPMTLGPFASSNGCILKATLSGSNEVPPGSPSGAGTATLIISRPASGPGMICFQIQVSGLKLPATAAHIHSGPAGIAGPVIVPLAAPDASGKAEGCVSGISRSFIKALLLYPQNYYANVHTTDFPGGAARGQLMPGGQ